MSLPQWGEYIILELDPAASVAWIDDPEVTKACQSIKTKKYVGCVSDWLGFVPPAGPNALLPVYVGLLSRGMVAGPEPFMLPEMSMPVGQGTPHPLDREAITPNPPLPWSNCYHPTLATVSLCVHHETEDTRQCGKYSIPSSQSYRFGVQSDIDFWWKADLEKAQENLPAEVSPRVAQPDSRLANHVMPDDDLWLADDCASVEGDADDAWSTHTASVYDNGNNFCKAPVINFSVDLESLTAEEISNPFDFLAEIAQLKRIIEDHEARVKVMIEEAELLNTRFDEKAKALKRDVPTSKKDRPGLVSRVYKLLRRTVCCC